jgi:lysophospholipase L1-like esterase
MLLAVFLFSGTIFLPSVSAKSEPSKKSLVALGDSISFGYNLGNNHHPSQAAFPFVMGKETKMRVRNLGVPGWGTDQLLTAIQQDEKVRQAVRHADVVTLEIGSTDFLQGMLAGRGDPEILKNTPIVCCKT